MRPLVDMLRHSRLRRIAARTWMTPFDWWVRLSHPGIPRHHTITRVRFGARRISIEHRRWTGLEHQTWGDETILDECFRERQYDLPGGEQGQLAQELYQQILASGKKPLILDCGANIGASVLWFAARYPGASIVAIEPAPDNFDLLARNCKGLDAELRHAAIGAADGTAHLSIEGRAAYGYQTNFQGDGLQVQVVSLRSILASFPASTYTPFLLKVDIEGAEQHLFSADHGLLDRFPIILFEPHDSFFPGKGTSLEFFRFHAACRREFAMNRTTIASVRLHPDAPGPGSATPPVGPNLRSQAG